ncbi:unnamed protein product [Taenia asiatica]|uniref:HMG box domain-containing protein n=1 Tax=Taenia asiatica TaxID=60517 RepID=A0A0R3WAI6_TAEAS|nr:unnamed protein product [Taenia asiatica]
MEKLVNGFSVLRLNTPLEYCVRFVAVESRKVSVFSAYVKAYFNEVKSKHPVMKTTEIMKKLSEMYKTASPSELAKLTVSASIPRIKTEEEKLEDRKKLSFARKHGLPKSLPITGYHVYLHDHLSGNKAYISRAQENRLAHFRNLKAWSEENGIQFSKRTSVLVSRFYAKHHKKDTTDKSATNKAPPK